MNYLTQVKEDPETGDLIIEFSDELMEEIGWKVGDTLIWEETLYCMDNPDKQDCRAFTLRKADESD